MTCRCSMTASPGRARATARFPPLRDRSPARRGRGRCSSGSSRTAPPAAGRRQYWVLATPRWRAVMPRADPSRKRCAIYTRKSSEEGLEQEFNSLEAQREACEAFIRSQRDEGWVLARTHYDDGGFSGGTLERPALQCLLADIRAGRIDIVVVYKVDRLTRSLADFARLVEIFDAQGASFGHRQLVASGQLNLRQRRWNQSSLQTDTADFGPDREFLGPGGSVLGGSDMITAKMEQVVDLIVGGEEPLRLAGRFELLHLPLSSARRLVRVFRSVVEPL